MTAGCMPFGAVLMVWENLTSEAHQNQTHVRSNICLAHCMGKDHPHLILQFEH